MRAFHQIVHPMDDAGMHLEVPGGASDAGGGEHWPAAILEVHLSLLMFFCIFPNFGCFHC